MTGETLPSYRQLITTTQIADSAALRQHDAQHRFCGVWPRYLVRHHCWQPHLQFAVRVACQFVSALCPRLGGQRQQCLREGDALGHFPPLHAHQQEPAPIHAQQNLLIRSGSIDWAISAALLVDLLNEVLVNCQRCEHRFMFKLICCWALVSMLTAVSTIWIVLRMHATSLAGHLTVFDSVNFLL